MDNVSDYYGKLLFVWKYELDNLGVYSISKKKMVINPGTVYIDRIRDGQIIYYETQDDYDGDRNRKYLNLSQYL